jgi:hypothetical protein
VAVADCWLSCLGPLVLLLLNTFKITWLFNLSVLSVPDQDYSRNAILFVLKVMDCNQPILPSLASDRPYYCSFYMYAVVEVHVVIVCGLSWVEANQCKVYCCLYIYCRWRSNCQEEDLIPLTDITPPHCCTRLKDIESHLYMSCPFLCAMFKVEREVVVYFVDISGIFYHHRFKLSFQK